MSIILELFQNIPFILTINICSLVNLYNFPGIKGSFSVHSNDTVYALSFKTRKIKSFYIICFIINGSWLHTKRFYSFFLWWFLCNQAQRNKDVPWNCSHFRRDAPMWLWISGASDVIGPHVNMTVANELTWHLLTPVFYLHYSNILLCRTHTRLCKDAMHNRLML